MIKDFIEIVRLRLNGVKLIDVDESVYDKFRKYVKGHSNDSNLEIKKRLTRNYLLGKHLEMIVHGGVSECTYAIYKRSYGNLIISYKVSKYEEKIINIYNRKGKKQDFDIDIELKEELNKKIRL